jgi:hypothetical protein
MGRYSSGMTAAGAGGATLPILGILSTATVSPVLREVGLFNTTNTECVYRLVQFTIGTAGAAQVERKHRRNAPPALATVFGLWTAAATIGEDTGYRIYCGAAKGSGAVLTFGDEGLEGDLGATSGLGLVPVGTGQVCEVYFVWDE